MNRQPRRHRILVGLVPLSALALAAGLGAPRAALAHGHGGGVAAASGPAAIVSAPATAFYGGFAQPVYANSPSHVHQAAYYQAQPSPPAPAAVEPQPPAANASGATTPNAAPTSTTAPATPPHTGQPMIGGPMNAWGGNWYLAPPICGYTTPGELIGVQRVHQRHPQAPFRFYQP